MEGNQEGQEVVPEETFNWTEFLEKNNCVAVPEELFSHVEASLSNGIKQGMLLEVCHKSNPDIYWIAEITMVCGHLLRIKFLGAKEDFWCDISSTKVHPLGWCGKYDEQVEPPDEINEMYGDKIIEIMQNALLNGASVSIDALKNKGLSPIDRIKVGMKVEVQNLTDPYKYWIATVQENVGGRLQLRYDGAAEGEARLWLFYSSPRLAGFGYVTSKGSPWHYRYPGSLNPYSDKNRLSAQLRQCAEEAIKEPTPPDLFQPNLSNLEAHSFVAGMRLEALDPVTRRAVRPATVAKIFNNIHFLVVIDDHADDYEDSRMAWLCDSHHPYIYPIGWAAANDVPFTAPRAWKQEAFDWDEYLAQTSSVPAPDYCFGAKEPAAAGMAAGGALEAVHPERDHEVHVGRVRRVLQHMLCVRLLPAALDAWCSARSRRLLPAGWCDAHHYDLHIPTARPPEPPTPPAPPAPPAPKQADILADEWCDRIYFNHKCYAGPSLSRSKLAALPQAVGGGPLALVLREVLNKLISACYKPAKLLRDWEAEPPGGAASGEGEGGTRRELLKAKLKCSSYHAYVVVPARAAQLEQFLQAVCRRLQACPALLALRRAPQPCACAAADKASFHQVTVERRGRPKGSFKKKKKQPAQEKTQVPQGAGAEGRGEERDDSSDSSRSPPPPRPTTRGAKLPNFALQMKEAHWERKDLETIYNTSCVSAKKRARSDSSSRSISDVSDGEEPELRKLRCPSAEPAAAAAAAPGALDPARWSADELHAHLLGAGCAQAVAARLRSEQVDGLAFILLDRAALTGLLHLRAPHAAALAAHCALLRCHYLRHYENAQD